MDIDRLVEDLNQQIQLSTTGYPYQNYTIRRRGETFRLEPGEKILKKLKAFGEAVPDSFVNLSVLDIGCNLGWFSFMARRLGAWRVTAIDNQPKRTEFCRKVATLTGYGVDFQTSCAVEWLRRKKIQPHNFVFCLSVFHHLVNRCWIKWHGNAVLEAFQLIARAMAKDGTLLWEGPTGHDDEIIQRLKLGQGYDQGQLTSAMFEVFRKVDYVGPALHYPTRHVYLLRGVR